MGGDGSCEASCQSARINFRRSMSQVTRIACVLCDPKTGDTPVRKPVSATSQELAELINHIIEVHTTPAPTVEEVADAVVKKLDARSATQVPAKADEQVLCLG